MIGDFEGGRFSTDVGAPLLRQADTLLNLTPRMAACLEDHRCQERHPLQQLVSQRPFGLLLNYEDVNDHDQFRADSVLALAVACADLTGEKRVRERDRGIPLAGRHEPGWARPARSRRTGI